MKKRTIVLIIVACVAGILAVAGGIIGAVFYASSGVVDSGDGFFEAARNGDYEAAYALTSQDIRRNRTAAGLKEYMVSNGLDEVVDTTWNSRSFENNSGKLEGSVTTKSGGIIPVTVDLVKENGVWKISYINRARSGLESE